MCGIAAIWNPDRRIDARAAIKAMTDIVRHRGPDDEGFAFFRDRFASPAFVSGADTPPECCRAGFAFSPVVAIDQASERGAVLALGHRRLSIIDLSTGGHQPMCTEDGRFTIVYNGEIYNYIELREELQREGCQFRTQSDTEVILRAYSRWGRECLHKFNGMFAFVLYDRVRGQLFAARDRFGVKPLYYWFSPEGFLAFASEIKQFTILPGWTARLNGQMAYDFLNWGIADHTSETFFAGVRQFAGGEFIEHDLENVDHRLPIQRWYRLAPRPFRLGMNEAAEAIRDLFVDSVRLRLRADVLVGTGLSGGVDSSSIVCVVNKLLRDQNAHSLQNTFSACSEVKAFDEREFIDVVTQHTGVSAHYTYPSVEGLLPVLPTMIWHQDEPFLSTSIYAEWCVFELVQQSNVKVTLDGHGSDELLAGYHTFFAPHFAGLLKSLRLSRLAHEFRSAKRLHGYDAVDVLKSILNIMLPEVIRQPMKRLMGSTATRPAWLNTALLEAEDRDPYRAYGGKTASLNDFSFSVFTKTSLPVQLHWADRDSMAHSVESRAPFLDYRLVECLLGLPETFKLSDGITKKVFRQAMSGTLPDRIRDRMDKMGFVTPEEVWIRGSNPEMFRAAVATAVERGRGIFRSEIISRSNGNLPTFLVWRMINFVSWMDRFGVSLHG